MPTTAKALSPDKDLAATLGEEGAAEYRRLLRVVRSAQGRFALFPIESDLPPRQRDAFLAQLAADLAADGCCVRRILLTREEWDVFAHPDWPERAAPTDVIAVVGLEETPGIVAEPGKPPARPPAIALLNQLRETLRKRLGVPLLLWCSPLVYTTLLEFAPDFFDHFTAQFRFPSKYAKSWPKNRGGNDGAVRTSVDAGTANHVRSSNPFADRTRLLRGDRRETDGPDARPRACARPSREGYGDKQGVIVMQTCAVRLRALRRR